FPFIAFGLFYNEGYYIQETDAEGHMRVLYKELCDDRNRMLDYAPLFRLKNPKTNEPITVSVSIFDKTVAISAWVLWVGQVPLILLDTDCEQNDSVSRTITHKLYPSRKAVEDERKRRLEQEIVLGIGGTKVLNALGIHPRVFHLNEGHAAFAVFEILR